MIIHLEMPEKRAEKSEDTNPPVYVSQDKVFAYIYQGSNQNLSKANSLVPSHVANCVFINTPHCQRGSLPCFLNFVRFIRTF